MNRKGLLKLIICISCMAFVLSAYTAIVLIWGGPRVSNISVILLDGQTTKFVSGQISMTGDVDSLVYNKEEKVYTASNVNANTVGTVKQISATVRKWNGKVYNYDVKIYRTGAGTRVDPYNVNNATVLCDYALNHNADDGINYNIVNDIDLKGLEWKPFGNIAERFNGTFEGNNYKISNMTIVVNNENRGDFAEFADPINPVNKFFTVGFFGVTDNATISNFNLVDYTISIDKEIIRDDTISMWGVGGVVGYAIDTQITGNAETKSVVSGKIVETSFAEIIYTEPEKIDFYGSNVGGVAGMINLSQIENINIDVDVTSQKAGAFVGGIVGWARKVDAPLVNQSEASAIKNCNVKANFEADLSAVDSTYISGIVADASNITIENVNVESINISEMAETKASNGDYFLSGAIGVISEGLYGGGEDGTSLVKNVVVKSMKCLVNKGIVSGFAYTIRGGVEVINSAVVGTNVLDGYYAAGFVHYNFGSIVYDNEFNAGFAVQAEVNAYINGAGFAIYNLGTIENTAETKVKADTKVTWTGHKYFGPYINLGEQEVFNRVSQTDQVSGFVAFMTGATAKISGFEVNTTVSKGVNMAGLVGQMGIIKVSKDGVVQFVSFNASGERVFNENTNNASHGLLKDCVVNAKFVTITYTNKVGGAVNELGNNAEINNVTATMTMLASDAESQEGACGAFVGGLVATICDEDATIRNSTVINSVIEVNYSDFINVAGENKYKWNSVGGLVGNIRAYKEDLGNYNVENVTFENCVVENTKITDTVNFDGCIFREPSKEVSATTGVGGFIGVAYVAGDSYTGCEVKNTIIKITETLNTAAVCNIRVGQTLSNVSAIAYDENSAVSIA